MFKLLFLFVVSFHPPLNALSLDKIFRFNDTASLKSYIQKQNKQNFLKILCEKQKSMRKIPTACYELSLPADFWCLNLKIKELDMAGLNKALKNSFLSSICREYLQKKQQILVYRKKDFLLPELKNYWTERKPFP